MSNNTKDINQYIKCDLSKLPKCYCGIDWLQSIGCEVPFTYRHIKGIVTIKDYHVKNNILTIEYKNHTHTLLTSSFRAGYFRKFICKIEDLVILKECVYDKLYITDPWIEDYLQSQDKHYLYELSKGSSFKLNFICPICGTVKKNKIQIAQVIKKHGISCPKCSDHISYPNKFGYALFNFLEENNIIYNYEYEYCPEWVKPYRYNFDHYYQYLNKEYIIEFDGLLGHGNKIFGVDPKCKKDTKGLERDKRKDNLAKENNVELIRINAEKSNFEFLKEQCINTIPMIKENLHIINWDLIEENCQKNFYKEVNDYYLLTNESSISKIAKHFKTNHSTIIHILKTYSKLGLNDYITFLDKYQKKYKQVIDMYNERLSILQIAEQTGIQIQSIRNYLITGTENGDCNYIPYKNNKIIEVFKDGKFYGEYVSMSELSRRSLEDLGVHLDVSHISYACNGKVQSAKGYTIKIINKK